MLNRLTTPVLWMLVPIVLFLGWKAWPHRFDHVNSHAIVTWAPQVQQQVDALAKRVNALEAK